MNKDFKRETDFFQYGHFTKMYYSGVYSIKCKITNLQYIGSSNDVGRRLTKHFSELRFNRHTNKKMQIEFNEYGIENFEYKIIEKTEDFAKRESIIQKEIGITNLYNEKITGHYISEELRHVLQNTSKETHKTEEYRLKMSDLKSHKIMQITREGFMHCVYNNMRDVIDKNPTFKAQPIRGVCNGSKKTAYNYKWKYLID